MFYKEEETIVQRVKDFFVYDIYYRTYWKLEVVFTSIKYAYQRVVRGYDDTAKWDLSTYLTSITIPVLKDMIDNASGHPHELTEQKWKDILSEIIAGFELMDKEWDDLEEDDYIKNYKKNNKQIEKSLKLFAKWYRNLWD